jgi:hypothetical protein
MLSLSGLCYWYAGARFSAFQRPLELLCLMKLPKILLLIVSVSIAGCDDNDNAALQGGGPGYATPTPASDVAGTDNGFCGPQGGLSSLGTASFNSGNVTAKIDTDGNPAEQGQDADWKPGTSGSVNGQAVNSAQYNYVVMSQKQMYESGASLGDWATVTNTSTGQTTFARVEDEGPPGGLGEISQATASAVGIQYVPSSATVGNPTVDVQVFSQTASIQGDCPTNA